MRTIGESMRIARLSRGYTVRELAEEAGVGKNTIYKAERNQSFPGVLVLVALADVLEIGLDEYVGRSGE